MSTPHWVYYIQPSLYLVIKLQDKNEVLYIYIGVGLMALLVSTDRAMREPLECGTSDRIWLHVLRLCTATSIYYFASIGVS